MKQLALIFSALISLQSSPIAWTAEVTMAFGESLPPYVISDTDSGIEVDIVRQALQFRRHTLKPVYVPQARIALMFIDGTVDAVLRDTGKQDLAAAGGHQGDVAVVYSDAVITLKERNLAINKPADLHGLSVIAFRGAAQLYPEWLRPVKEAGNYAEKSNQILQVKTLHAGRYDAVWSDVNIFAYYSRQVAREGKVLMKPIKVQATANWPYRPMFRDAAIRDDYNAGLKHLREVGRYQQIVDSYLR